MKNKPIFYEAAIRNVQFGEGVRIVKPVNLYDCVIGDNCFIGPFTEIQKGVKIGNNTKIESHSFLCEGVSIGNDCFIAHGVMFINDRFNKLGRPAYNEREYWERTLIGNNVSIGSNSTILPVHICDYVVIGAGAVVTKDIEMPGIYAGVPAKYLRAIDSLADDSKKI